MRRTQLPKRQDHQSANQLSEDFQGFTGSL